MRKTITKNMLIIFLVMFCAISARAGDEKDKKEKTVELPAVEVVGSPIVQSTETDRYAQEKTIVSDDQIEDLNAGDLGNALRRTPGVTISRYNLVGSYGGGDGGAVYLRGMGSDRPGSEITLFFDGAPKANSVWAHPLLDTMSTDMVEEIEIYLSPQPAYIGASSGMGAVNLVPRRLSSPGKLAVIKSGGGTHGTWFETGQYGQMSGPWDFYFMEGIRESEGHREHSAGRIDTYYVHTGYAAGDNIYISLNATHSSSFAEDPGPDTAPAPDRAVFNVDDSTMVLTVADSFENTEGYIKAYVDRGYINWQQPTQDSNTPWQNYGLRARQVVRIDGLELMGGVDGTMNGGEFIEDKLAARNNRVSWELWRLWEPYLAISYQLGDREGFFFIPSYGHRWSWHGEFDNKEGWQAGVVTGYQDLEFHANMARAWNYPGQYVRYFYQAAWSGFYKGDEYQDLDIERVDHWEAGVSYSYKDLARLNFTWFNEEGDDKYVWVFPPPPPPKILNLGEFSLSGYDASLTLTPNQSAAIYLGYSRIMVKDPDRLPRAPEYTISAGASVLIAESLKLCLDYQHVSDQFVGDPRFPEKFPEINEYGLVNAKAAWLFHRDDLDGDVWVAVENMGDVNYEYLPDYPMPGAVWMGGVSLSVR